MSPPENLVSLDELWCFLFFLKRQLLLTSASQTSCPPPEPHALLSPTHLPLLRELLLNILGGRGSLPSTHWPEGSLEVSTWGGAPWDAEVWGGIFWGGGDMRGCLQRAGPGPPGPPTREGG